MKTASSFNIAALPFIIISSIMVGFAVATLIFKLPAVFSLKDSDSGSKSNSDVSQYLDYEYLDEVYKYLDELYIDDLPTKEKVTQGAVKGIIDSLDSKYSAYLNPEEAKAYLENRSSDFEGIGITLAYDGENTYVETVLEGFPASKKDIQPGDVIVEVDGKEMSGVVPALVATDIRGEKGTTVKIKLYRANNGNPKVIDVEVVRDKILVDSITWKKLDNNYVMVDIAQFTDDSPESLATNWDKVVSEIQKQVPDKKGIVIDLRNNPGGFVISVRYILEEFLPNGSVLMSEESKVNGSVVYRDSRVGKFENTPMVVIVNEGSASAAEIFAAGISENDRGKIVGMKTVGKGVEQLVIDDFEDGAMLLLVFQKWLTPDGNNVTDEKPITPDFEVDFTSEDAKNKVDPQLDKALELLK